MNRLRYGFGWLLAATVLFHLSPDASAAVCTNWRSWIFGKCPQRPPAEVINQLRQLMDTELSGQKVAAGHITSALSANVFSERRRPFTFHFSGPTGVGKSLCSSLVARALFSESDKNSGLMCGLLHKKMRSYEHLTHDDGTGKLAQATGDLESEIARQLEACPRSVIILDDIERLSSSFLDFLEPLLDIDLQVATYVNHEGIRKSVGTRDALFILISDLNEAKLSPDLTTRTAQQLIRQRAKERWSDSKAMALIERTVPFLPLTEDEMRLVADQTLGQLERKLQHYSGQRWKGKLAWGPKVAQNVCDAARRDRPDENARAIATFVEVEVRDALFENLDNALLAHRGMLFASFNIEVQDADSDFEVRIEPFGDRSDSVLNIDL